MVMVIALQYVDDEGDKVLLATDSDLVSAVNFAKISGWKVSRSVILIMKEIDLLYFDLLNLDLLF